MIDRVLRSPVLWTWVVTILRTGGFFFVLPIVLRKIPSEQLGLWYVFLSVAQFSSIVELGFAPNISRFASYFMGGAANPRGLGLDQVATSANEPNLAGLAGLTEMGRHLYGKIALVMGMIMTIGGGIWLTFHFGAKFWNLQVAPAFFLYAIGMTVNMYGFFWMDLLFGVNQVRKGQQVYAIGLLLNYLLCVIGLLSGAGLYALALGQIALALLPRWMARRIIRRDYLKNISETQEVSVSDLWPMTWRSGLCSFGAHLSLPALTLICAQVVGLTETAKYGLSLQLALMLHALSSSWMSVIWPRLSGMRARHEYTAIRQLVSKRFAISAGFYLLASVAAWAIAPPVLHLLKSKTDFLPPFTLALLLAVVGVDMMLGICNAILLTGNRAPHMRPLLINGVLTVGFALVLGKSVGVTGIVLAPLCAHFSFNLWVTPRLCWNDLNP